MPQSTQRRSTPVNHAARRRWTPAALVALAGCAALSVAAITSSNPATAQTRNPGLERAAAVAQPLPAPAEGVLRMHSGEFDLRANGVALRDAVAQRRAARVDRRLLQVDGPMSPERRRQLEDAGVQLGQYMGDNIFIADIAGADADKAAGVAFVRLAADILPEMKIDALIGSIPLVSPDRKALRERGESLLMITLHPDADLGEAVDALERVPGVATLSVEMVGDSPTLIVQAPTAGVRALAQIDDVQYIEEAPEATLRNADASWVVQSNINGVNTLHANGLTGVGQVIGIMDGKIHVAHCSFHDPAHAVVTGVVNPDHRKILAYNAALGSNAHGTHVAGTAAGDNGVSGDLRGVAYGAKIVFHDIPNDSSTGNTFYARLSLHHNQGARVHTNSWGQDFTTNYTGWSRAIDLFSRDFEESVVMFAVSNQSALYTPENAKSVLAVAASQPSPNQHNFCSGGQGPTADGRRKPEIYAPGCSTTSASVSACGTAGSTGTSMAAPAIAGATALVRQYFVEGFYPSGVANPSDSLVPTGALMRATVINAGQDMTGLAGYPGNREGWGRLLANASLYFPGDARTMQVFDVRNADPEALSTNDTNTHTVVVNDSAEQLRVTMAFTDLPGAIGSSAPVVNNIDLEVESPAGAIYRGNVFSGGVSVTGGAHDPVNTVEQVHVNNPQPGTWTIRVKGTAVNQEAQGYAVTVTGALQAGCEGDLDGDGFVDGTDLGILLLNWGACPSPCPSDLDANGTVDGTDLGLMLLNWGPCA